jgi:serine/threonine protein kinase
MVSILSYLQKEKICHRDLKPQNIVKKDGVYKLIDLDSGLSFEEDFQFEYKPYQLDQHHQEGF